MKLNTLLMTSALTILSAFVTPFPQAIADEKAAAPVSEEVISEKIKACKELQDPAQYEDKKVDSYAMLLAGKDGWIFRTKSDFKMDYTPDKTRFAQFLQFQKTLEKKGIKLYISFLPNRGIIGAPNIPLDNPLAADYDVAKAKASYNDMANAFRKSGVHFITYDQTVEPDKFFRGSANQKRSCLQRIEKNTVRNCFQRAI